MEGVVSSIGICVWRFGGRGWRCRRWYMPRFGTEVGYHVGSDAGGGTALAYATEEGSHGSANRCAYVHREVRGYFSKPFDVSCGREVGQGVGEELEFHGDAIKEFGFVLIQLGEDGVLMLKSVFDGREVAVRDVRALAARAIGYDVIIEKVGVF